VPTWVFEGLVAPLAAALAFDHARRALGAGRAAGELAALAAYGFAVEVVAMALFATHEYDESWRAVFLGMPLAVAVVWAAVITSAMAVAGRRETSRGWRAFTAAVVAIALDLVIDPVATRAGLWDWTPPGPWLGVPIGNFVAWGLIVGSYAYGAELWAGRGRTTFDPVRRLGLAAACIVVLMLVAAAWTSLGFERVFADGRGWAVWAAIQAAVLWRMLRPDDQEGADAAGGGDTLPVLLAATPGRRPEAALCVVGIGFALEALSVGQAGVTVAAVGSLATIAVVATRRRSP
jgi:hypothetical protein